jgi:2-polyprenyl-3-methyl-5-hydroxy-6-metoxy-1,4-benzoquinol methylase
MGFDISKESIKKANSYKIKNSHFSVCDLSDWDSFTKQKILKNYDIVLFLGTYHHLNENRDIILNNLLNMCSEYFLFRTAFSNKQIPENIIKKNFKRITRFIWKRS